MSLEVLQFTWYALTGAVLILFAFTAGFDLGVGTLLPFIAKNNHQRRVLLNVIGPTWDGNQVWLIIAGGALFVAWPYAYALAFSGFYFGMMLLLWALFLRPVSFEWRAKINKPAWHTFWDYALFLGSVLPAFAMGLLIGNLMRGVPFYYDEHFRLFYTGHFIDLFNGFSVLTGMIAVLLFVLHGALYLQMRTEELLQNRCRIAVLIVGLLFLLAFAGAGYWIDTHLVGYDLVKASSIDHLLGSSVERASGALWHNFQLYPLAKIAPLTAALAAVIAIIASLLRYPVMAFICSGLTLLGTISSFGIAQFPFLIPSSSNPNHSLTLWNASASRDTLQVILIAVVIMLPTIGAYTFWVFRAMRGKVTVRDIVEKDHTLY